MGADAPARIGGEPRRTDRGRRARSGGVRTLSSNILRAFSRIATFFCCISRRMTRLGASLKFHLSCFAKALFERHVEKRSQ